MIFVKLFIYQGCCSGSGVIIWLPSASKDHNDLEQERHNSIANAHIDGNMHHTLRTTKDRPWAKCIIHGMYDTSSYSEWKYHQASNISLTLVGNKIVAHSDVVGASPNWGDHGIVSRENFESKVSLHIYILSI